MLLNLGARESQAGSHVREFASLSRRWSVSKIGRMSPQDREGITHSTSEISLPTDKINEHTIIATLPRELWISSRDISRNLELSQPKVLEILLDSQLNRYRYSQRTSVSGLSLCTASVRKHRGCSRFDYFIPWGTWGRHVSETNISGHQPRFTFDYFKQGITV